MEILKLLKELETLIENQKTFVGLTYDYHPDEFLVITNKIRAAVPELLSSEKTLDTAAAVLARHFGSQSEVDAIITEIRAEARV
jgi:hypothetical protein